MLLHALLHFGSLILCKHPEASRADMACGGSAHMRGIDNRVSFLLA